LRATRLAFAAFAMRARRAYRPSAGASLQPPRSFHRTEKFFAAGGAFGVAAVSLARKTRESVPTDSLRQRRERAFAVVKETFDTVVNRIRSASADG
jgi:hypothetical protein